MDDIEFNFEEMIIQDKEGNQIDLSRVKTLEDLKNAIIYQIEFPYCKNCGFYPICPYKKNTPEDTCALLDPVMRRYIDMNIKSIDYNNPYFIEEFIKSCHYFIHMCKDFLDLMGVYTDDEWNDYFESTHPSHNSLFSHKILIGLSKYLDSIRKIDLKKIKKFIILVEGDSDKIILRSILKSLRVLGIDYDIRNSIRFYILEGKGRIKKEDSIRDYFKRFREIGTEYFLFLDKDAEKDVENLVRAKLIQEDHIFYFENELEEEYNLDLLIEFLEQLDYSIKGIFLKGDIKKRMIKEKSLKITLEKIAYESEKPFNLDKFKLELAKLFALHTSKELEKSIIINGVHRGDVKPISNDHGRLVERIRPLADKINEISKSFYVPIKK